MATPFHMVLLYLDLPCTQCFTVVTQSHLVIFTWTLQYSELKVKSTHFNRKPFHESHIITMFLLLKLSLLKANIFMKHTQIAHKYTPLLLME